MGRMKDEDYQHLTDHSDGRPYANHGAWEFVMTLRLIAIVGVAVVCVLLCLGL
jgi:hypothetical protein